MSQREIEKKALSNDNKAIKIYNDFGNNLGLALSHVVNILDPNVIVLGGGLSNAYKCFSKSLCETFIGILIEAPLSETP